MLFLKSVTENDLATGEEVQRCQWEVADVATKRSKIFLKTRACPDYAAWNFADKKVYFATVAGGEVMEASWPSTQPLAEKKIRDSDLAGIETLLMDRSTNRLRLLNRKLGTTTIQTHEYLGDGKWKSTEAPQNSVVADKALNPAESAQNFSHASRLNAELRATSKPNLRIPASMKKRVPHCRSEGNEAKECVYLPLTGRRGVLMSFEASNGGYPVPPIFYCFEDCKKKTELKNAAWEGLTFRLVSVRGDYLRIDGWLYKFGQTKPYWPLPADEAGLEPIWFDGH